MGGGRGREGEEGEGGKEGGEKEGEGRKGAKEGGWRGGAGKGGGEQRSGKGGEGEKGVWKGGGGGVKSRDAFICKHIQKLENNTRFGNLGEPAGGRGARLFVIILCPPSGNMLCNRDVSRLWPKGKVKRFLIEEDGRTVTETSAGIGEPC